jgi:hypothetical protein
LRGFNVSARVMFGMEQLAVGCAGRIGFSWGSFIGGVPAYLKG